MNADLSNSKILKKSGFTTKELSGENWRALQKVGEESWTQAMGRGAYLAKLEGLLVPSARKEAASNFVLLPKRLAKTSKIEIPGADQLPK